MADMDWQAAIAALQTNTGLGSISKSDPPVYMGHTSVTTHGGDDLVQGNGRIPGDVGSKAEDKLASSSEAKLIPYQSDATREGLGQQMYQAGLIADPNDYDAIIKMWGMAVDEAANFQAAGRKLTPWQVLDIMGGKTGLKREHTSTQTQTSIPNPEDLARVVEQVYKDNVGRAPNPSELAKYAAMLKNSASKNPTKTTTTTQYDASGQATNSDSTTQQGADASTLAYEAQKELQDTKEFGAQQAGVYYMNVLGQALGSVV